MEEECLFVSSRGIRQSCDLRSLHSLSSAGQCRLDCGSLQPGGSVYVCTDAIEDFVANYMPKIPFEFNLYTGDSDRTISDTLLATIPIQELLNNPQLKKWYAQNNASTSPKVNPLPIGVDYHTCTRVPNPWSEPEASPKEQEYQLILTTLKAPTFKERRLPIFADALLNLNSQDRIECEARLNPSLLERLTGPLSRQKLWTKMSQHMFVLSPPGRGIDCHRTWEALILGCVPIVKKGLRSEIFNGMPVVQIDTWSQITQTFLEEQAHRFIVDFSGKSLAEHFKTLFLSRWTPS